MDRDQPPAEVRDQSVTDTRELLGAAGYTTEEIDELTEKGVVA